MRKFLARFWSHPWILLLSVVASLALGLHFYLQWQSERRWAQYCAEARARGVKLNLLEFTPPPIPESENFASIPMLKEAFAGGKHPFALPGEKMVFGDSVKGVRMDWAAWQAYFKRQGFISEATDDPVRDCLRALDHYAPQFRDWSEWRTRPKCQFPLDLNLGAALPLPHLGTFQNAAWIFALRMRAHLALGDSAAAYDDFREGLQAYLALREEPTTIGGLVRISVFAILIYAVGDGLEDRAWAVADLRRIEADLSAIRVWGDYRHTMECEHAFSNWIAEALIHASPLARVQTAKNTDMMGEGYRGAYLLPFVPAWVLRDNQLRLNRYFDEMVVRVDAAGDHIDQDRPMPSSAESLQGAPAHSYYFLLRFMASIDVSVEKKYLMLDARLSMLRLACALERYRQEKGAFPVSLEELIPNILLEVPADPYIHSPFHYRRTAEGSFRLYSVGLDRHDDGGVVDPAKKDSKQNDDIWLYAPRVPGP